ncbi:hypothetical protein KEC56_06405 [Microbacterium sp. YMB-B2]|uniref:Uncharacterized protein n=1 Tax=Microbacterium tenebrionis TaxID=2830665 RepID=A0A9X1LNU3_9MICO|nr:hypothetical protein [Microbacterium tenebrionis]MCC2029146.1 hypothetical protein [Microbacterium tenebrionis]
MDAETQALLYWTVIVVGSLLATLVTWLLLYSAIRMGVFHGLRAHTRWIDDGKDYEKVR